MPCKKSCKNCPNKVCKKSQGYNARLDESLGMRHRGKKSQSLKSRRKESKGAEKGYKKRPYRHIDRSVKKPKGKKR